MSFADLHIHTFYSDGTSSPEEVVEQAQQAGLCAIAITDHDTIDGIEPTIQAASKYNLEVISGIELSSEINNKDIHILGYFFDHKSSYLHEQLEHFQNTRIERMKMMIEKLNGLGISGITFEEVAALAKSKSVGRPHLATILVNKGKVGNLREAFDKYLAEGAPAYVAKYKQTPFEAIDLIEKCGGIAVMAHPAVTGMDEIIPRLVRKGLRGLEVYYPFSSSKIVGFYEGLAKKHHLFMTGGSDSHGKARNYTFVGKIKIPYTLVEDIKKELKK